MDTRQVEMYRAVRERRRAARLRGEDTDEFDRTLDALWSMMSDADRRAIRGVGEPSSEQRRAA